jgi:hypothetical protein
MSSERHRGIKYTTKGLQHVVAVTSRVVSTSIGDIALILDNSKDVCANEISTTATTA